MKRLSITQLVPGMTVAEDVYDLDHELLIQKGTILTDKLITKLDLYGILTIFVEDIIQPVRPAEDSTEVLRKGRRLPGSTNDLRNQTRLCMKWS